MDHSHLLSQIITSDNSRDTSRPPGEGSQDKAVVVCFNNASQPTYNITVGGNKQPENYRSSTVVLVEQSTNCRSVCGVEEACGPEAALGSPSQREIRDHCGCRDLKSDSAPLDALLLPMQLEGSGLL
ncbi:hypothetical protein EYF80_002248 [Liparis tanakae]|uniref:Uncharacterized protein n=1 Tax=Liparis tanakae TaxID=230148 RepID=A0A4Z2JBZ8_9TELE|nr:hypothetical protein EYF80_002248 [Liparis tanakae]